MTSEETFREHNWSSKPIRDLGLKIEGTRLEPVVAEFQREIEALGLRVRPRFYLSTEWGVVTGTIAIAIPFYLAEDELSQLHAEKGEFLEGRGRRELLRYLRHELGHVVNYAYKLYDDGEWVRLFGPITQPYLEDYRPSPFSRRYVRHLPGWYAQKHPDEDWAETFAVWMTPGIDWRNDYADQPLALSKLEFCDRTLRALKERDGNVLLASHDGDFLPDIEALLGTDRRVGILGFKEFVSASYRELESRGLAIHDLESEAHAFNAPLPRVRIIPVDEFDPADFL